MAAGKPRLLLVEDELILLDVLSQAFRGRGWQVDAASGGSEALALHRASAPDVVLTDKNLPGMSGVELIQKLRAADRHVGIILMTAYGTVESARDTLNLGVDEYLEKPFDSLFAVVELAAGLRKKVLERRQAHAEAAGPITILVAAAGERRARLDALLAPLGDRVLHVAADGLKPSARSERASVVILDGASFPEEITCLVAEVRTRARASACVVLSEQLSLSDVKRLIQLEVKALIEVPLESPRFAALLTGAVERLRGGRQPR